MAFICPNCNSSNVTIIDTYKQSWRSCNDCGNVIRERKQKYFFQNWPFRPLIEKTFLKRAYGNSLLPKKEVIEEERRYYDYYFDTAKIGEKGTKWENANDKVIHSFQRLGIVIQDKEILDISGGPGFLTQRLKRVDRRAVVTEFSQDAVKGMREALNIEAVKFDYNNDSIDKCVTSKFDLILIIYSIGFCNDLRGFLNSLKKLMHPGTMVFVSYSPPTLGLMMRWQFDDYTYTRCWQPETVAKCFAEIGMKEIVREDDGSQRFDENWYEGGRYFIYRAANKFHRLVGKYYLWKALNRRNNVNRELIQKNIKQLFAF